MANHNKTYFFDGIARRLADAGIDVCWIVVARRLRDFLVQEYGATSVLYLSKHDANQSRAPLGDYHLNELVQGDRVLRHQNSWAYSFLENIQAPIRGFLEKHHVRYVFGELTWAHEILIHRIVGDYRTLGAQYLCPHTVRIPIGRFGFFRDEFQSDLVQIEPEAEDGVDILAPANIAKKPEYLALNDQRLREARSLRSRMSRLKRFFTMENIDRDNPVLIVNRWISFKIGCAEEINREMYRTIHKSRFDTAVAARDYVFVALHKQPESSIDVIGRYYDDQLADIVNIWRALPDGWSLVVKEHSNAIGDRSAAFYRKLRRLRNVILVDERSDSREIIRHSKAVVTVSGTVAYEAALMGIPAYTFADVFFNRLGACHRIGLDDLRSGRIGHFDWSPEGLGLPEFGRWLKAHSADGIISDPVSNPACMEPDNLHLVARAFLSVCGSVDR